MWALGDTHRRRYLIFRYGGSRLGADAADRASQCLEWDDEQTFGLPEVGARVLVYRNRFFSVL